MIEVRGLTKTYKRASALADIDLTIAAGECFGLVGTNGAGRTTLLNILATLVRATAGQVTVDDLDVVRHPMQVRRRIGYVAESHSFYEDLRVHEFLSFMAASHRLPAPRRRTASDAVLAHTSLERNSLIRTLSKGCRQQLAIAAALLHEPAVLLLDEPMTHLDLLVRQRVRELLQARRDNGATILCACNAAEELQGLCNRVGVLHRGRLVAVVECAGETSDLGLVLRTSLEKHAKAERVTEGV